MQAQGSPNQRRGHLPAGNLLQSPRPSSGSEQGTAGPSSLVSSLHLTKRHMALEALRGCSTEGAVSMVTGSRGTSWNGGFWPSYPLPLRSLTPWSLPKWDCTGRQSSAQSHERGLRALSKLNQHFLHFPFIASILNAVAQTPFLCWLLHPMVSWPRLPGQAWQRVRRQVSCHLPS